MTVTKCQFCQEPGLAYVQVYVMRKKVKAIPVCLTHGLIAHGLISLGQDQVRSFVSEVYTVKKGSIPRLKVSLTP